MPECTHSSSENLFNSSYNITAVVPKTRRGYIQGVAGKWKTDLGIPEQRHHVLRDFTDGHGNDVLNVLLFHE